MIRNFFNREAGQGLVEYALILVLIAIVVIGVITMLGSQTSTVRPTCSLSPPDSSRRSSSPEHVR